MEFLQNIKLFSVPRWLQVLIVIFLLSIMVANFYVAIVGLSDTNRYSWVQAATNLLGVLLPIFLVVLILAFSQGGINALKAKTEELMIDVVPKALSFISEPGPNFDRPSSGKKPSHDNRDATITPSFQKGSCVCEYKLCIPMLQDSSQENDSQVWHKMYIRLEINVKKVNCILYLPRQNIVSRLEKEERAFDSIDELCEKGGKKVADLFKHTIAGAKTEGYSYNETLITEPMEGESYLCFVLVRHLSPNFLWDPAEKLSFSQDLMFMLRSFYLEQTEMFEVVKVC